MGEEEDATERELGQQRAQKKTCPVAAIGNR
jgi:hypothetical protein